MEIMLRRPIHAIRRRLQLERLLKGVALVIGYLLVASLVLSVFLTQANFSDAALWWGRFAAVAGFLVLAARYVVYPLWRRPSRRQVARFLEERYPDLRERVSTAVEVEDRDLKIHPEISLLIQNDATRSLRGIRQPRFYWPQTSATALIAAIVSVLMFSILYLGGPDAYRYSLRQLLAGWLGDETAPLYQVVVEPGHATVAERADMQVTARLVGFQSQQVQLFANYEGQPNWEQARMAPALDSDEFHFLFFDIRDPIQYYVEADGIRSDTFRIDVSEVARLTSLSVTLAFPRYTGMQPVTVEDDGNVSALEGTTVEVVAGTDQPVSRAILRFEEAGDIEMTRDDAGTALTASFKVTRDDFYRIYFANSEGVLHPGSDEFFVESLLDQPPTISFTEPGRDRRVNNIEEVYTEVKAEDDHGLQKMELRFAVNGDEEKIIPLEFRRGSRSQTGSHTMYLEELDLEPGDFITYYAFASDARSTTTTDMYFLEIEPYDREFFQGPPGGGGGGGGQGNDMDLARQQKQVIVATFSLENEKDRYTKTEFDQNSQTLGLIEQRLQGQARTIIDRIMRRGAAATDPKFQKMVEFMEQAIVHMGEAERLLNGVSPAEALPEEQKAYLQLLRAEVLFKEMQVSMGRGEGGGGATAEQLADLVDLELDRTKNQYETLQQNRQQQQDQQLDEALEKLKELSRRQEQNVQRRRQAMQSGGSGGSNLSEEQLLEELEELARQLSRLSRDRQDQQLNQVARELQRAARNLRQAQQSGQNTQEAQMQAQQALERLRQAQQSLQNQRQNEVRDNLGQLSEDARRLAGNQSEVVDDLEDLERDFNQGEFDRDQFARILREKDDLQRDLQSLETQLHQNARQLESTQPEVARRLKQAGNDIRDDRLSDKMTEGSNFLSRGLVNMARKREEGIEEELQKLADQVADAQQALGQAGGERQQDRMERALNEVGSLVDKLNSMEDRAQGEQQGRQPGQQQGEQQQGEQQQGQQPGEQQGQQPGQRNQQGQQPGQQPGQQGQEGRQPGQQQEGQQGGQGRGQGENQGAEDSLGRVASPMSSGGPMDPRQAEREWRERLNEARNLQQLLQGTELGRDADQLFREMQRVDARRLYDDPEELARLKSIVIDGFHQLELELSQALIEDGEILRLVNDADVPPEFRERVAEYYRRLSTKKPNQ